MRNSWQWGPVTKSLLDAVRSTPVISSHQDDGQDMMQEVEVITGTILRKLGQYNRVFVGFSGGLDSTVLLHSLARQPLLINKLIAVHINHCLSVNAPAWQSHCQQFCNEWHIPLVIKQVEFEQQANIEDEARKARYQVFELLVEADDCLILGHHLNDQAETLLLQLLRGAGIDGLAAMAPIRKFSQGWLLRPFLQHSRQLLEVYAQLHQLQWIDDESNQDIFFSRNYLRHQIMPLLCSRWPAVVNNLARTTKHCQQAQANLDDLAKIDCPALTQNSLILSIVPLIALSTARISNILRFWFKSNKVRLPSAVIFNRLISEVIQARNDANPQVSWGDICVRRYQQTLYLLKSKQNLVSASLNWSFFPQSLDLEGRGFLHAKQANKGIVFPPQSRIEVRFRQGGELFNWHGQTKQLKKLFQEWRVPPWLRDCIPLLYINAQLASVVGYAVSDLFYQEDSLNAYQLYFGLTVL